MPAFAFPPLPLADCRRHAIARRPLLIISLFSRYATAFAFSIIEGFHYAFIAELSAFIYFVSRYFRAADAAFSG